MFNSNANNYYTMNTTRLAWRYTALALAIASLGACTRGFDEINRDPLTPPYVHTPSTNTGSTPAITGDKADIALAESIEGDQLTKLREIENSIGEEFRKLTYEGLVDNYQRTTNLTHDIYAGYFAHNKPDFNTGSPCYSYTPGWSDKRWEQFYQNRTAEYQTVAKICRYVDKERYHNAFYMARIYYAFLISTMTDTYGDMPIIPMVKCEPTPEHASYASQEMVYDVVFALLDEAIREINPSRGGFVFEATDDKCFGGDLDKWVRFANTLRLRLALRISNINPERAKREGELALTHPKGVMRDHGDRMRTVPAHAPEALGGYNEGGRENDVANCSFRYVDAVMSKDLEIAYKELSQVLDPRCPISWYRPTPMSALLVGKESRKDFAGCEIGSHDVVHTSDKYSVLRVDPNNTKSLSDTHWFSYSREYLWLGYAECKFLQAEAALRGWAGAGGSAEQLYLDGIRASMGYYNLPSEKTEEYISGLKINPFTSHDREAQLEAIITQKWLAIFPNGNEAWAEVRRTDYPRLRYPVNTLDPNIPMGKFIKRVSYPASERVNNPTNVPNLFQGDRIWWDVMDTNRALNERNMPNNFR